MHLFSDWWNKLSARGLISIVGKLLVSEVSEDAVR